MAMFFASGVSEMSLMVVLQKASYVSATIPLIHDTHRFSWPMHQACPRYWDVPHGHGQAAEDLEVLHLLPIEQDRHLRLPRHSRICRLCHTGALGDERHMLLECSALSDLRAQFSKLNADCLGVMARLGTKHGFSTDL